MSDTSPTAAGERLVVREEDIWHIQLPDGEADWRIANMAHPSGTFLGKTALLLNAALIPGSKLEGPRTGQRVAFPQYSDEGVWGRVGLMYTDDFMPVVSPHVVGLCAEVALADTTLARKALRCGQIGGVAIAQGQPFSYGNKRTARAYWGLAAHGRDQMLRACNATIDFMTTPDIEESIFIRVVAQALEQNGATGLTHQTVAELLERSRRLVDDFRFSFSRNGQDVPTMRLVDSNGYNMWQHFKNKLSDNPTDLRNQVAGILLQRDYGPAAHLIALGEANPADMDDAAARTLVEASRRLLTARILHLTSGVAAGGIFPLATDLAGSNPRKHHYWLPKYTP